MRAISTLLALALTTQAALAQAAPPPAPAEQGGEPISSLMLFTLIAALVIGVGALVMFMRKRSNREVMDRTLNPTRPENK